MQTNDDGTVRFDVKVTGKRPFQPTELARALFKVALGMVAFQAGHEVALDSRYHVTRNFILKGGGFANSFFMAQTGKPTPEIRTTWLAHAEGTLVAVSIFGMRFFLNLEEIPRLKLTEDLVAERFAEYRLDESA